MDWALAPKSHNAWQAPTPRRVLGLRQDRSCRAPKRPARELGWQLQRLQVVARAGQTVAHGAHHLAGEGDDFGDGHGAWLLLAFRFDMTDNTLVLADVNNHEPSNYRTSPGQFGRSQGRGHPGHDPGCHGYRRRYSVQAAAQWHPPAVGRDGGRPARLLRLCA